MTERKGDWTTGAFEESRPRLRAMAYRMLGSGADADDVVQEAWLRLHRADAEHIENFQGWLTTVVARICLDTLRSRRPGRSDRSDRSPSDLASHVRDLEEVPSSPTDEPDHDVLLAETIGPALMVVLDRLTPAERLAFVLHDLFAVPFDEIAPVVGRSVAASRQLASRARRRVRGQAPTEAPAGPGLDGATPPDRGTAREQQRTVVAAFLKAARGGDLEGLLDVLDPDVVVRVDSVGLDLAARYGARGAPRLPAELRGAEVTARTFAGWARGARAATVGGMPGAVWAPGGRVRSAFSFDVRGDRVVSIDIVADPDRIAELEPSF